MASETLLTDPSYWNGRGPHGGWIAARLLDAAAKLAGPRMAPRTLMVDFMDRIQPGEFVIDVQALARHPHVTFWHVTLQQAGRTCVHATAVFAVERNDGEHVFEPAPAIGAPRAHPQVGELASLAAFPGMFDYRIAGGWPGTPGARALTHGFVRPKDERRITAAVLAMLADAWFPALWAVGARVPAATVSMALVFTSNDTAYPLRADDYLQARFTTSALAGDFGDESARLWWPDGRLAVKAQQLLRYGSSTHALIARSRPTEKA